ncbi:MAG: DUF6320 domain-containing protein [Acholeplasmataceae bacterium]|jgi:hypothetical protein|nr:DUF6320 domain-containing protein [Acholeplasmataceae bacterium]
MKYCKTCHVHYDTTLEHCILCNGELENEDEKEVTYKFSECQKRKTSRFFHRLFIFINIVSILISLYIDFSDGLPLSWSLIVSITNLYAVVMFILLAVPTIWTSKFTKSVIVTIGMVILIGLAIRDHQWALDYVFPFAVMLNILLITILIIFNRKKWFDYFSALIIVTLIGLVPGLLNLLKVTEVTWPSVACFSYALVTLLGIIFLPPKASREEFRRRFHV